MVHMRLRGEPYACNEAGPEIDHPFIDSRDVDIGVEHGNSIGEEKVNCHGPFSPSKEGLLGF